VTGATLPDTTILGLTASEACARPARVGPNAVVDVAQHPVQRAVNKLWAPVPWMLEAAIVLQIFLKDYVGAMPMISMLVTGDFLAMSSSTDNVSPSPHPNIWRIRNLTIAGIIMGAVSPVLCIACLAAGTFAFGLGTEMLQTLAVIILVFSGQSVFYVARERRHLWSSVPGRWLVAASIVDLSIVCVFALNGILMTALPIAIVALVFVAAIGLALVMVAVMSVLFQRLAVT